MPQLSAAHAATHRSKSSTACSGLLFGPERRAPDAWGAEERLRRRLGACPTSPISLPFDHPGASAQKLIGAGVAIGGVTCYSLAKLYADQQAASKKGSRGAGPTARAKPDAPPEGWRRNGDKEGGFVRKKD